MADTRYQKLGRRVLFYADMQPGTPFALGWDKLLPRLEQAIRDFQAVAGKRECERCNAWMAELTPEPVAVGEKLLRVCHPCLKELKAKTPVYTKQ